LIVLNDPTELLFGVSPALKYVLMVPQVCAVLAGVSLISCFVVWILGYWYLPERLHFSVVAMSGVAFTWLLHYWNLLPFGV
jgi:hypothetical protein